MKNSKLADIIANSINNSIQKNHNTIENRIFNSVNKALLKAEAENTEILDGDTVSYYIERTCEELANKIKDIQFESKNSFSYGKAVITNVTTDSENTTKVNVTQEIEVNPVQDIKAEIDNLLKKFALLSLPTKFAKYIVVSSKASETGTSIELNLVFNLPKEYISAIEAEDFLKRNSIVNKEIKKLLDTYFG